MQKLIDWGVKDALPSLPLGREIARTVVVVVGVALLEGTLPGPGTRLLSNLEVQCLKRHTC